MVGSQTIPVFPPRQILKFIILSYQMWIRIWIKIQWGWVEKNPDLDEKNEESGRKTLPIIYRYILNETEIF
jgi:hypothetical protein